MSDERTFEPERACPVCGETDRWLSGRMEITHFGEGEMDGSRVVSLAVCGRCGVVRVPWRATLGKD